MPRYSDKSKKILHVCHGDIRRVMDEVIKDFDISITESYRGADKQNAAYSKGLSQLMYPESKHNKKPCEAFHCLPYPFHGWENTSQFVFMAGYIMATADRLYREGRISRRLRWGGNWDQDNEVITDQEFDDLAHFELESEE